MQDMELRGIIPAPALGAESSLTLPQQQLLCLSLHDKEKIRVMNLPGTSIAALRNCIELYWPYGIQSERKFEGLNGIAYQFKLRGRPWRGGGEQADAAMRLLAGIFGFLLQTGWVLKTATNLSKWKWDRDTLYFKQDAPRDPSVQVCVISFNMSGKLRVIKGPPEVSQVVRSCIHNFWHRGLQREGLFFGSPEFKLRGTPWKPHGTQMVQTRMFVGQMIEALDCAGWEFYASVDISHGEGNSHSTIPDLDSWILRTKVPSVSIGISAQAPNPQVSDNR